MTTVSLVGAQWGSEGKGVIAAGLARMTRAAVRVGGPNAGHSLYHQGVLYKMRSVPCAWVDEANELFIGAGAVVNPHVLVAELEGIKAETGREIVVKVDPRAVLITEEEEQAERGIVASIGSTGEGVGAARVARIKREGDAVLAGEYHWQRHTEGVVIADVAAEVNQTLDFGALVMLEGTQGSGLSLYHGTQYPYVTSDDTNVASLLAEVGIAPSLSGHVQLVCRTFPIRVAGNSGPMGEEMDWQWFVDRGIVDKPEKTTVTKKVRRISTWYEPVVARAMMLNRPCGVWVTFGDYLAPELRGTDDPDAVMAHPLLGAFIRNFMDQYSVPVLGVGMGPHKNDEGVTDDFSVVHLYECSHVNSWDWNWWTAVAAKSGPASVAGTIGARVG